MLKHSLKKGLIALSLAACFALPLQAKIITDVEGNKIELPDNVQRVADLWHANNQIVLLLGGQINWSAQPHLSQPILGIAKYIQISKTYRY